MVFIKFKKKGTDKTVAMKRIDFAFPDNMEKYAPRVVIFEGFQMWTDIDKL